MDHPITGIIESRCTNPVDGRALQEKLDEYLDVYSFYLQTRIAWIHDEVRLKVYELRLLDSRFNLRS